MTIRYFIESALQQGPDGRWYFTPIGVWAHGPGLGMDIAMAYLPGYEAAQAAAEHIMNDIIERGVRTLPIDFLDQQQSALPLYRGDRSPIYATEGNSADGVSTQVLALIAAGKPLADPPLPLSQS